MVRNEWRIKNLHLFFKDVYNWKVFKTGKGEWNQEAMSGPENSKNKLTGINHIVEILQKLFHPVGQIVFWKTLIVMKY